MLAAQLGRKVAVLDYVSPSPQGKHCSSSHSLIYNVVGNFRELFYVQNLIYKNYSHNNFRD